MTVSTLLAAILAVAALCTGAREPLHWNAARGYAPFAHASADGVIIDNDGSEALADSCQLPAPLSAFTLTFRAESLNNVPGKSFPYKSADGSAASRRNAPWGFFLSPCGNTPRLWATIEYVEEQGAISSEAATRVSLFREGDASPIAEKCITQGISHYNAPNIWQVTVSGALISISAGNRGLSKILEFPYSGSSYCAFGFVASPAARIKISDITITPTPSPADLAREGIWNNPEELQVYLENTADPLEGIWTVFDRTLEEDLLKLGGDYRLAIVKDGETYVIVYLGGASVNAPLWKPGMIKGILNPSPFPGIYDAVWYDAEELPLSHDIKAQTGEGATLLIQFPYQSSQIRLRRLP